MKQTILLDSRQSVLLDQAAIIWRYNLLHDTILYSCFIPTDVLTLGVVVVVVVVVVVGGGGGGGGGQQ